VHVDVASDAASANSTFTRGRANHTERPEPATENSIEIGNVQISTRGFPYAVAAAI
jgi:hypothetical protein